MPDLSQANGLPVPPVTGLVCDAFYTLHEPGAGEPDSPLRIGAIEARLVTAGLMRKLLPIRPRDAMEPELRLVHSPRYLRTVRDDVKFGAGTLSTGDTSLCEYSLEVAQRATGGVLAAVDAVVNGQVRNAFCAVRPPGHHASHARGMGFCIFNHVAIAARYAQKTCNIGKVLIVDWDVHHGNGTQETFYDDGSVLFFSAHQHPLYPGTGMHDENGTSDGLGLTINAPLPAGSGYRQIAGEMERRLGRAVHQFKPELILISAGFDSRVADPLGDFTLEDEEYALLTRRVMAWADDYAGGRIVSVLEGGYNLRTLGGAVAAHVAELADARPRS